jgi:hypothetical protein
MLLAMPEEGTPCLFSNGIVATTADRDSNFPIIHDRPDRRNQPNQSHSPEREVRKTGVGTTSRPALTITSSFGRTAPGVPLARKRERSAAEAVITVVHSEETDARARAILADRDRRLAAVRRRRSAAREAIPPVRINVTIRSSRSEPPSFRLDHRARQTREVQVLRGSDWMHSLASYYLHGSSASRRGRRRRFLSIRAPGPTGRRLSTPGRAQEKIAEPVPTSAPLAVKG